MASIIPSLNELTPYFNRADLLEKVIKQIEKDFNWFNITLTYSNNYPTPYLELFNTILPLVENMLSDNYSKLYNILYRIDIDDNLLTRKLKELPNADTAEVITDLILKRELQKIIIREIYTNA